MDRFQSMSIFVTVADEGGFAAAARRLRISPPAVTRAVAALEQRLGAQLLHRTTRHVRVTAAGQRYLEDARRVLADADAADASAAGADAEPRGRLAVTAPVLFGRMFVLPRIVEYLAQYPHTDVSAVFVDRLANLVEEGLDVAIRIGELPDSSLRAARVGSVRMVYCASPDYLRERGTPKKPHDLTRHAIIASVAGSTAPGWRFAGRSLKLAPRLTVTDNDAAIEAALRGAGVTRVLSYQVARHVEKGALAVLLERYESAPRPIHVVHREGRNASAKVRAFVDLAVERLRADPAVNGQRKPGATDLGRRSAR